MSDESSHLTLGKKINKHITVHLKLTTGRYKTVYCLTGVMINREINLLPDKSSLKRQLLLSLVSCKSRHCLHQSDAPKPSQGILQQIASLLCKFVQAINSISFGVPIWQQEWLESWAARCLSLGTEMRAELQWSLKLRVIVTSLCSCVLFSSSTLSSCPYLSPLFYP